MPKIGVNKISTLKGHKDAVYALSPALEKNFFYSAAADGMVVQWNLEGEPDGDLIARVPNSIYAIHFLPRTNQLIIGHNYDGLHFIDPVSRAETASLQLTTSAIFDIQSFNDTILVASGDGNITGVKIDPPRIQFQKKASNGSARAIAINTLNGQYAVGFSDNYIRIYTLSDHNLVKELPAHGNSVFALTYSPTGEYLLSGGRDAHLKIWNVFNQYSEVDSIVAHLYAINHICYSPAGNYFATCSLDKSVKIWSSADFRLLKVIDRARHGGHMTSVNRLFWSDCNNLLVSCSDDRSLSVWDINFNV
jgi:WD40 repeat protein